MSWAADELGRQRDRPFFQAVGIFRPHILWYAPTKYFDLYPIEDVFLPKVRTDDLNDVPPAGHCSLRKGWHRWLLENDEWRSAVRGYLASISFADAQVGRLLDALDASPHAANTIVVLWSDHGMHIGEKQYWEKFTLFEESTRVPLMIVAPGITKPGLTCDQPVSLLDVYPTLIELCGIEKRDDLDGVSLVPLLRNPSAKWDRPAVTTWGRGSHAIRSSRWRYIRHANGDEELYDHRNDPDEFHNLVAIQPSGSNAIIAELKNWLPQDDADSIRP